MLRALALARALEEGHLRGPVARALSRVWARASRDSIVRALPRPDSVAIVAVGGSTLGGSGKTPLAIACARALAREGSRVAFVGHAYGANPGRSRLVERGDRLAEVGDEALVAVDALADDGVPVVVGPTRAQAVAHAAERARILVIDGVVQTRPRASLSLLAVDGDRPWGAGAVPPCGDLRAPVAALEAAIDAIVRVGDGASDAPSESRGVWVHGQLWTWPALTGLRVGLVTALARPGRVVASLRRRGVQPMSVVRAVDHGRISARALRRVRGVDLWVASPKCAFHVMQALGEGPSAAAASRSPRSHPPLGVLDHRVVLSPQLLQKLRCLDPANRGPYPQG